MRGQVCPDSLPSGISLEESASHPGQPAAVSSLSLRGVCLACVPDLGGTCPCVCHSQLRPETEVAFTGWHLQTMKLCALPLWA